MGAAGEESRLKEDLTEKEDTTAVKSQIELVMTPPSQESEATSSSGLQEGRDSVDSPGNARNFGRNKIKKKSCKKINLFSKTKCITS